MDARVYVTDGQKTIKLFWLQHDGNDVHCVLSKFANKLTYHGSGELHTTQNGQNINRDWRAPLAEIKGLMHLTTISSIPQLLAYSDPISKISKNPTQLCSSIYDQSLKMLTSILLLGCLKGGDLM
jgi:hypothetical protein